MAGLKCGLIVYMDNNRNNKILSDIIDYLLTTWEEDQIFSIIPQKYDNTATDDEIGIALVQGISLKLIVDRKDRAGGHHFSLAEEAHRIISIYGSYLNYIENKQGEVVYKKAMDRLKTENMVLVNLKLKFFIVTSLLSFIAGILLSDQIKSIWLRILSISE